MRTIQDEMGVIEEFEACNGSGRWWKILIVKGLSCLGSVASFGYIIVGRGEGMGYRSVEETVAAVMFGLVLGLLTVFA